MTPPAAEIPRDSLPVTEIFYSLQGEATHSGRPCVFVRLTGCDLRCRWCDTGYAFHGGEVLEVREVVDRVRGYGCSLVQITGGEPLLHSAAPDLLWQLLEAGHEVLLETGGHRDLSALDPRVRVVMDLKCPGSGESDRNRWENLAHLREGDALKLVVADRGDYEWARQAIGERELASRAPVFLSPVHGELSPELLAGWILEDRLPVRLQLQIHKLIWGPERQGV